MTDTEELVFAVPKGRIWKELQPLMDAVGIEPEAAFADKDARQLRFNTNVPGLSIIRVRSFDVATFVAFGAAHLGVSGADVLMEFDYSEIYAPLDLGIAPCRLVVAELRALADEDDPSRWSHVRVATKYPNITHKHFAARGVQAECIKLNGAMELGRALQGCGKWLDDLTHRRRHSAQNSRPCSARSARQPPMSIVMSRLSLLMFGPVAMPPCWS